MINRTLVDELTAWRDGDKDLRLNGSGLGDYSSNAPKKGACVIVINVTTLYCPNTSDRTFPSQTWRSGLPGEAGGVSD